MQISNLLKTITKPALYEPGNASMWEDDHISHHLLQLHLNQNCDAASRKRVTIEKTVQWIEKHLDTKQKSILDLGCGPGLYCELLAEHGYQVTGVDFSKRSIDYARQSGSHKGLLIEYIQSNYLDLTFENLFDLIIIIFCDFDVLVPHDRTRLLKNIFRALKPGGLFIFDTLNPKAPAVMAISGKSWEMVEDGFWKKGTCLVLSETFHYEEANVILQQHVVCSEPDQYQVYRFWTHYYQRNSIVSILIEGGFSVEDTCDDLLPDDGSGTHDMVTFYVARKM
ncbi:MAG: class I SAM-dependent methyltransferase [Methanospirillaceae archaeon]|nr:class I SAM-dependent methyltransferase [Methanospirillaceae archaeon]